MKSSDSIGEQQDEETPHKSVDGGGRRAAKLVFDPPEQLNGVISSLEKRQDYTT